MVCLGRQKPSGPHEKVVGRLVAGRLWAAGDDEPHRARIAFVEPAFGSTLENEKARGRVRKRARFEEFLKSDAKGSVGGSLAELVFRGDASVLALLLNE